MKEFSRPDGQFPYETVAGKIIYRSDVLMKKIVFNGQWSNNIKSGVMGWAEGLERRRLVIR